MGLRDILNEVKPDLVLVHGDTATSTAAAFGFILSKIPVGHIEAGLRTHNIYSPWPEEMNRQISTRIANLCILLQLPLSKQNLLLENISKTKLLLRVIRL